MSPAKTGADYYLDFDCTVLKSSLVPEGFGYVAASGTLYTTSVNDTYALNLAKDGITYQYFSDKDCNNAINSVAVAVIPKSDNVVLEKLAHSVQLLPLYIL